MRRPAARSSESRDLANAAVKHGVRLPSDFTMMFKAMATIEGRARTIAAGVNPIEAARPYIEALIKERYSADRIKKLAVVEGHRPSARFSSPSMR